MMKFSVRADVRGLERFANDVRKRQIPFATSQALNATAFEVQREAQLQVKSDLKHPRPFTVKAFAVLKSTKAKLTSIVYMRPEQERYLDPYIFGGNHVLMGSELLNPKDIRLDQYGQLRKGQVRAIAGVGNVFVGTVDGVSGFWLRVPGKQTKKGKTEKKLRLLIRFGSALPVKEHIFFFEIARHTAKNAFPIFFKKAMAKAMKTAR